MDGDLIIHEVTVEETPVVVEVLEDSHVIELFEVGVPGVSSTQEFSTSYSYNPDGTLLSLSNSAGTKTFGYSSGRLATVTGTGIYKSKSFQWTGDRLTSVTVL